MIEQENVRRHADGALDIGFYRRRARKVEAVWKLRAGRSLLKLLLRALRPGKAALPAVTSRPLPQVERGAGGLGAACEA